MSTQPYLLHPSIVIFQNLIEPPKALVEVNFLTVTHFYNSYLNFQVLYCFLCITQARAILLYYITFHLHATLSVYSNGPPDIRNQYLCPNLLTQLSSGSMLSNSTQARAWWSACAGFWHMRVYHLNTNNATYTFVWLETELSRKKQTNDFFKQCYHSNPVLYC